MILKFLTALSWVIASIATFFLVACVWIMAVSPKGSKAEDSASTFFWAALTAAVPNYAWLIARYLM